MAKGECEGDTCVRTTVCSYCKMIGTTCIPEYCAESHGSFEPILIGQSVSSLDTDQMTQSELEHFHKEDRFVEGIGISATFGGGFTSIGAKTGDMIVAIDGEKATRERVEKLLARTEGKASVVLKDLVAGRMWAVEFEIVPTKG